MIYVECKPDQVLVQMLTSWSNREIIHEEGKYRLMAKLSKRRDTLAMVDEDPNANQPAYLSKMQVTQEISNRGLRVLADASQGNRVVVLCPKLEDWIISVAEEADVSLSDRRYNLPNTANALHKVVNIDPRKLERLVQDLADTPRFQALRELLKGRVLLVQPQERSGEGLPGADNPS